MLLRLTICSITHSCFPFSLFISLLLILSIPLTLDVIQLKEEDEYWLQLFPSRGIVSERDQMDTHDRIFEFFDGRLYYMRQCSLIKLPFDSHDERVKSKLRDYNMTEADIERGSWSIFPVVQENIF
jgi:hypothetical protein